MLSYRSQGEFMLYTKLLALGAIFILSACQNYSENSLAGDKAGLVKCPANGCASALADSNELSISWAGKATIVSSGADQSVQIGGDCYPSTYPTNRIDVQVRNSATNQTVNAIPYSPSLISANTIQCEKGRYNILLNTISLPTNNVYRVSLTLIGIENGIEHAGGINSATLAISR